MQLYHSYNNMWNLDPVKKYMWNLDGRKNISRYKVLAIEILGRLQTR